MGMTIDKTIEFFNGLACHTPQAKDARDVAVNTMRKCQLMQADCEARLKADLEAILTELHIRMEEIGDDLDPTEDWDYGYKSGVEDMIQLLDERIDKLKGESDAQEQKKE